MNRRTARGNRLGLTIVGLALVLGGLAALLRGLDVMPRLLGAADVPVTDQRTRDVAAQPWFWPVLAAVLLLIALLALRWLAVQTRSDGIRTVHVEPDSRRGQTRLPARAVAGAVEDDLAASPYLRRAQASLTGSSTHPRLYLSATMDRTAEPAPVLERVREAIDRIRRALDEPRLPATVQFRASR